MTLTLLTLLLFGFSGDAEAKMRGPKISKKAKIVVQAVTMKKAKQATDRLLGAASPLGSIDLLSVDKNRPAEKLVPISFAPTSPKSSISIQNTTPGAKPSFTVDENAIKGEKRTPSPIDDSEAAKRQEHRNPPTASGPQKPPGIPQRFDHMWPICFFIDPAVKNGNQIVADVTKMAARCKVNVVAFPFFVKPNYPKDPNALNQIATRSCNAIQGMGNLGVARASVVTLVADSSIPKKMCNATSIAEVNSCAQVGYPVPRGQQARMEGTGTWGGQAKSGESAAAIVGPGDLNGAAVAGRVQGQAQMALPRGAGGGNQTGGFQEGYATAGAQSTPGWSDEACEQMRKTAFPNTGNYKYLPTQENYVALGKNLWDIQGERQVFNIGQGGQNGPLPAPSHPRSGELATSKEFFKASESNSPSGALADLVPQGAPGVGHKVRTANNVGASDALASTDPAKSSEDTGPKIANSPKIGGQLKAIDGGFMGKTESSSKSSLAKLPPQKENGIQASLGNESESARNPSIRSRAKSAESPLDPNYLAGGSKRNPASSSTREKGAGLRKSDRL